MKASRLAGTAAVLATVLALGSGTSNAAPPQTDSSDGTTLSTQILPGIHYTASVVDRSVVLRTDAGTLTTQGDQFQVLDVGGNIVAGIPLTYQRDGKDWPIAARIEGRTATLVPSVDPTDARATSGAVAPLLHDVDAASDAIFDRALLNAATEVGLGIALGSLIGTAIGAGVGCIAGGAFVGAAAGIPTVGTLAIPGFLGGCLITGAAAGAIGAVAGTIIVGIPVAIAAAIQFFDTLNQPAPAA